MSEFIQRLHRIGEAYDARGEVAPSFILEAINELEKNAAEIQQKDSVIEAAGITVAITDKGITWGDEGEVWGENWIPASDRRDPDHEAESRRRNE